MWTRRVLVASAAAAASLVVAPAVAGAATTNCYSNCSPPQIASTSTGVSPSTSSSAQPLTSGSTNDGGSGSSSLPFTGADVEELAVIGAGAVIVGTVLNRRRRAQA